MEKAAAMPKHGVGWSQRQAVVSEDLLADVFASYYKRIYNYICCRINDPDEAEDITSQVFEKVLHKIDTFRPERAPLEIWIFAIAHHAVNDYYRGRKYRQWFSLESARDLVSPRPSPEEAALRNEETARLSSALHALGDRERNIVALRFAGRLKNRDIAELTGMTESNVGVILYRSLRQLRSLLQDER